MSSKVYILWIEYSLIEITAWYCKGKSGARVIGVCAHIAAILWYLGYARHNPDVRYGGKQLEDASDMPHVIDESESDTDGSEMLNWLVKQT